VLRHLPDDGLDSDFHRIASCMRLPVGLSNRDAELFPILPPAPILHPAGGIIGEPDRIYTTSCVHQAQNYQMLYEVSVGVS
jgi:hypothetical protein